jgi:hypothetical protein
MTDGSPISPPTTGPPTTGSDLFFDRRVPSISRRSHNDCEAVLESSRDKKVVTASDALPTGKGRTMALPEKGSPGQVDRRIPARPKPSPYIARCRPQSRAD